MKPLSATQKRVMRLAIDGRSLWTGTYSGPVDYRARTRTIESLQKLGLLTAQLKPTEAGKAAMNERPISADLAGDAVAIGDSGCYVRPPTCED